MNDEQEKCFRALAEYTRKNVEEEGGMLCLKYPCDGISFCLEPRDTGIVLVEDKEGERPQLLFVPWESLEPFTHVETDKVNSQCDEIVTRIANAILDLIPGGV